MQLVKEEGTETATRSACLDMARWETQGPLAVPDSISRKKKKKREKEWSPGQHGDKGQGVKKKKGGTDRRPWSAGKKRDNSMIISPP